MQIIIVQEEIETAIRNHILSQINVKDGMRIDIELAATRGADGFKATIDIVADGAPVAVKVADVTSTAATGTQKAEGLTIVKKEADQPKQTTLEAAASQTTAGAVVEAGTVQTATAEATDPATTEATEGAVQSEQLGGEVKAPARSLFAGLKKPVNG